MNSKNKLITTACSAMLSLGVCSIPLSLAACSSGSTTSSSPQTSVPANSIARVSLSSTFVQNPLVANTQYALMVSDGNFDELSIQVINCKDIKSCEVEIGALDKVKSNFFYLQILNKDGGLVAATAVNRNEIITGGELNSTPIIFSEVTTGSYLLSIVNILDNAIIPNYSGSAEEDLIEFLDLDYDSASQIVIAPVAAYLTAQNLGLATSETQAILNLWANLYVDVGAKSDSETAQTSNISTQQTKFTTANLVVSDNSNVITQGSTTGGEIDLGAIKQKQADEAKQLNTAMSSGVVTVQDKDRVDEKRQETIKSAVNGVLGGIAGRQAPATQEQLKSVAIAKGVCQVAFGALNLVVPGVGSALSAISTTSLDFFYPQAEKPDPNAVLVEGLTNVETAIKDQTKLYEARMDDADRNTLNDIAVKINKLINDLSQMPNEYVNSIGAGASLAKATGEDINYAASDFNYASLLDTYIRLDQTNDAKQKIKDFFNTKKKADALVSQAMELSDGELINNYMDKLNNVRNNQANKIREKAADPKTTIFEQDFVQLDQGYYSKVLLLETSIIKALDKARNYQLAAAYLKFKSAYRSDIGVVHITEPGISYTNYEEAVGQINKIYEERMLNVAQKFKSKLLNSETLYARGGANEGAKRFYAPGLLEVTGQSTSPLCNITYWDGINLETSCPKKGVDGKGLTERINQVSEVCGPINKIDLHDNGKRLYCEAQLVSNVTMMDTSLWIEHENKTTEPVSSYVSGQEYIFMPKTGSTVLPQIINKGDRTTVYDDAKKRQKNLPLSSTVIFSNWNHMPNKNEHDYQTIVEYPVESGIKIAFPLLIGTEWYKVGPARDWQRLDVWSSLGCSTSDCTVIGVSGNAKDANNQGTATTSIYFSNGSIFDLTVSRTYEFDWWNMQTEKGATIKITPRTPVVAGNRPYPYGTWQANCDPSSITFKGGVLAATCSVSGWSTNSSIKKERTTLNIDQRCMLGSKVRVNTTSAQLECVNPR